MKLFKFVCAKCDNLTIVEPPEFQCECGAKYGTWFSEIEPYRKDDYFFTEKGIKITTIEVEDEK